MTIHLSHQNIRPRGMMLDMVEVLMEKGYFCISFLMLEAFVDRYYNGWYI